jgi:hypothetical protein
MTENVHALLGAYVVDAVSPEERAAFEAHLPGCEECTLEAASLEDAVTMLALAEQAPPPLSLRARVRDEVARTSQLPPGSGDDAGVTGAAGAAVPVAPDTGSVAPARRRVWPRLAVAAAAAAVLATGGLVASSLLSQREAALALEKDVMMVASAPDARSVDLGLGSAHVVTSARMGSIVAMGDDCPDPKPGMEYQLWLVMEDGAKVAGPTFMPAADGTFMTLVDADMGPISAVAVTQEPHGGSDQPTSEAVAEAAL